MKNLKLKGFTLVEILIVIVIIGVLMAVVLRNLSGSQEKARNTGRIQVAARIATEVQQIIADTNGYPPTGIKNIFSSTEMPKDPRGNKNAGVGDCFSDGTKLTSFGYISIGGTSSQGGEEGYLVLAALEPQNKNTQATVKINGDACGVFGTTYAEAKKYLDENKCGTIKDCEVSGNEKVYYAILGK